MDDYWNSLGGISNIDAHQLAAINLQYPIKPDPALTQQQYNNQGFRYQPHGLVPTDQYGVPLGMNMYPSYGGSMSESLEERIRNSFADIDEERVLSLSSPEPELDQFLFPELAQASHNGTTSSPLNPPSQNSSPHLPSPTNTTTNTTAPPAVSVTGPIQTTPISQAFPTFHHQNQVGSVVQQSTSTSRSKSRETSSTTRHSVQANPSSSCEQSNSIEVILYHKPRGCKGVWQKVGQSDALRVTKGKGKWLKLEIKSHYEIKANDVDVFLVDATNSSNNIQLVHTPDEGITIESKGDSTNMGFYIVDVELKLDRVCKKLQMWCVAKNNYGFFKGKSVDFSAHNNGKANNKVKAEEIESQSEGSSSSSTSSSSREAAIATIKKRRRNDHTAEDESPSSVVPGSLKVNGVVRAKAFLQYSDLRLKANIADLVDAVNIVSQLKGRTYTWKSDSLEPSGGKRVIGLIAQEVRRVVPEVVHENEDGFLAVSYAELVPILIEALKEHIKKHETDKTEVKNQLAQLESKLDSIANVVEKEAMVQAQTQHQINMLHHNQQIHSQTIAQLPPTISVIPPHLKGLIFMEKSNVEEEFIKDTMYKRNFLRVGVVVTFILGLMTIMLGAILIGMTLSSPSQSITTTIVQARNLKQMDPDGAPDAYVEVSIGAQVYRTKTIWNDNQPSFEETFSAPLEGGTTEIIYQLYDDNVNPYFPPRRMGFATLSLAGLGDDKTYTDWLPLVPNLEGDQVSGDVQASIYISKPKQPGFELVLLFAGVFLTSVSLGLAFYVWKTSKQLQQQKQSVQMSNFKP